MSHSSNSAIWAEEDVDSHWLPRPFTSLRAHPRWMSVPNEAGLDGPMWLQELGNRWRYRSMILLVVACIIFAALLTDDGRLWMASAQVLHIVSLWVHRHGGETAERQTECAFDTLIGTAYLARGSLELGLATQECKELDEISKELREKIWEIASERRLKNLEPQEWSSKPLSTKQASAQVDQALARARGVLDSLHLKHVVNRSSSSEVRSGWSQNDDLNFSRRLRRLNEPEDEEGVDEEDILEVAELKKEKKVYGSLCGLEIAGLIGSYAWVAAYLAAATTECTSEIYLNRYCASDISRVIAASADIAQASNGIYTSCTDAREARLGEELEYELDGRRLANRSAVLPPEPQEELLRMASEEKRPFTKDGRKKVKTVRKNLLEAECSVNLVQGALFLGRAALELTGVAEHCVEHFDFYETIRCAANAQGSLAAFAVTSHVFAEGVAQCKDAINELNLDAYCAGSVSQIVHGTLELTAALTLLADFCTLLNRFPYGRPEDREPPESEVGPEHIFHR